MKVTKILIAIILLSIICSCGSKPYPHLMQRADSLVNIHPDSALTLLEQLKGNIGKEPEATQMYYRLLTLKAKDNSYPVFTSDSLIRPLLSYYEKKKDKARLPEVYYYAGLTYRTLGDAPQAQDYLQKALNASKGSTGYRLLYKIYHQIGMAYHYNPDTHIKSTAPFKEAYRYAELTSDSTLMIYGLLSIARGFQGENADSLSLYYSKARDMALKINNTHLYSVINIEWGICYSQEREYQKAYNALQASHTPMNAPAIYFSTCANMFYEKGKLDSAQYYCEKMLSIANQYHNKDAYYNDCEKGYRMMSRIARIQGKLAEALDFVDKSIVYSDSLQTAKKATEAERTNALYNYQFREKENRRLADIAQKQKSRIMFLSASIIFILILVAFACTIYLLRKRQKAILKQQTEKLKETEYKNKEIEKALQEAEKRTLELTHQLEAANEKISILTEKAFKASQIYKDFYHVARMPHSENISDKEKLSTQDWEELTKAINGTYNHFTERLKQLYPDISLHEMRICMLLKIGIPPISIADLTAHSKQAINSSRKKLYAKTHKEAGAPELWDKFIKAF